MARQFLDVDPRSLRLPPSRPQGADPYKLQQQIARFGASIAGMPPPCVYQGTDGELMIYNGVTRATRIAKLAPGTLIRVEVVGRFRVFFGCAPALAPPTINVARCRLPEFFRHVTGQGCTIRKWWNKERRGR